MTKKYSKFVAAIGIIALFCCLFGCSGMSKAEKAALKDIETLQGVLLNPKSLIIYEAYVSFDFSEKGEC